MPVAKEQIRQIIVCSNISCVADVYTFLRDGFKDIRQELMEAELNTTLVIVNNKIQKCQRKLPTCFCYRQDFPPVLKL